MKCDNIILMFRVRAADAKLLMPVVAGGARMGGRSNARHCLAFSMAVNNGAC